MHSLFYVLSSQHGDDLAPMPCNAQTVARLVRHLEDVVNENNLPALVIEGRCLDGEPARETERLTRLCGTARHVYLFSCDTSCEARTRNSDDLPNLTSLEEEDFHSIETGPFILVMDSRFCGLLASYRITNPEDHPGKRYELIWTFDPNVAFTALEYLMARISVQNPSERERVESLLTACTTRSSSSRIALTFNTKLAMLLQRQNDLETAISSISSAISSTLDLETILQSAVEEVGRALKARHAALVLWEEDTKRPEKITVYERDPQSHLLGARPEIESGRLNPPIKSPDLAPGAVSGGGALDGPARRSHAVTASEESMTPWPLEIPISYRNNVTGLLEVEDDTPGRQWESEEVLMVRTASDQLAVAISHARLFSKIQTEAITDSLTALYNHRYFKEQLDREIGLAERSGDSVSLILLDLDRLKRVNDTLGHPAGDQCLIHVAAAMKATMRKGDICARYGGEEFAVILPHCGRDDAIGAAERLREAIAGTPVPRVGQITASVGVATCPAMAIARDELIEMADRAMYLAKASGRNLVRTLSGIEGRESIPTT